MNVCVPFGLPIRLPFGFPFRFRFRIPLVSLFVSLFGPPSFEVKAASRTRRTEYMWCKIYHHFKSAKFVRVPFGLPFRVPFRTSVCFPFRCLFGLPFRITFRFPFCCPFRPATI